MVLRCATLIAAALCLADALIHGTPAADASATDCPYGYGDGCDHFWDSVAPTNPSEGKLDPAVKEKLQGILGGLISSLSSKPVPRLVAISHGVVRSSASLSGKTETTLFLGSLVSSLQRRSVAHAAALLSHLAGATVDAPAATAVTGFLTETLAEDASSCPFGYGCGGGGDIDPATKAQVANILNGIIKNLSAGHRKQPLEVPKDPEVRRCLGSLLATLQSSYSVKGAALLAGLTNVGDMQVDTAEVSAALVQVVKSEDPCSDFGYGCGGGGGPISSATKAKVAGILNGIIKNLGGGHR